MLTLFRTFNLRYLAKHKLRTATIIFGVALGVMIVVSIMLLNQSILRSYRSLVDTVAGKATLQVVPNTDSGLPESIAGEVASVKGVKAAIPVVHKDTFVFIKDKQSGALFVYGIDPKKDVAARDYEFAKGRQIKPGEFGAIVVTESWAKEKGLKVDNHIKLTGVEGIKEFRIVGLLANKGPGLANAGLFALVDINTSRALFNRGGKVDQVDVVLISNEKSKTIQSHIKAKLNGRAEVEIPATRGAEIQKSLDSMAFYLDLAAMLAVFVGAFIIFNNLEMSVEERRFGISTLRALGLNRKKIFSLVVTEAVLLGIIGAFLGVILGSLLARAMSEAVAGYLITELRLKITDVGLTTQVLIIGLLMGPTIAAAAAIGPATRMLKVAPLEALKPFETAWRPVGSTLKLIASVLVLLIGVGMLLVLFFVPGFTDKISKNTPQLTNYLLVSIFFAFLGMVLLMPYILAITIKRSNSRSFVLRLALDNLRRVPGRTAATITGMMIALAMMITIVGMVDSWKYYVDDVFDKSLGWDILVQTGFFSGSANVPLNEGFGKELAKIEGVQHVEARNFPFIKFRGYNIQMDIFEMDKFFDISYLEPKDGKYDQMVKDLKAGGSVAVSAMFAKKFGYKKGDILKLDTPTGKARLKIVGVINDAGVDNGFIYIDRRDYKRYWKDNSVDAFAVKAGKDYSVSTVSKKIKDRWEKSYGIKIRENKEFRNEIMSMLDQQFALTNMIIYVAILVAGFGIMNSALINILQRKRELSVIRALGAKRRQIKNLILSESVITGFIGAAFGGIIGIGLGAIIVVGQGMIVDVPIKYLIPWMAIIGSFIIALSLTAIGSVIPARVALKREIVEGISYE